MTITTTVQNPEHFLRIVGDITKASRVYQGPNGVQRLHVRPWFPSDVRAIAAAAYRQGLSAVITGHTVVVSGFEQNQETVLVSAVNLSQVQAACRALGYHFVPLATSDEQPIRKAIEVTKAAQGTTFVPKREEERRDWTGTCPTCGTLGDN